MRLDPGLTVLELAPDVVQIGSGSRSTQLMGCSAPAVEFLLRLVEGIPDGREAEAARSCGLDPAEARTLESTLSSFLRPHAPPADVGAGHAADLLADDLGFALALDGDPMDSTDASAQTAEFLGRRRHAHVQVLGLGRTGAVVARLLASAGVGRLTLWDRLEVAAADVGTGYLPADLGRIRSVALGRRIDDVGLGTVVLPLTSPDRPGPGGDVTVVVSRGAVDYDFVALARTADHPVLPVVARDDDLLIGPWFAPGLGGCPLCWDLAAEDTDPHRAARNAVLLEHRAGREDVAVATAAGALAARHVVRWAETGIVPAGVVLHLRDGGNLVDTLTVPAHPDCGCAPVPLRPSGCR